MKKKCLKKLMKKYGVNKDDLLDELTFIYSLAVSNQIEPYKSYMQKGYKVKNFGKNDVKMLIKLYQPVFRNDLGINQSSCTEHSLSVS